MTVPPLALVFLGAIALASLIQAALLAGCALALYRAAGRAESLGARTHEQLLPHLSRAAEFGAQLHEIGLAATRQLPELELAVQDTARRVRHAGEVAERTLVRPLAALGLAFAFYRAYRRAAAAWAPDDDDKARR